MENKITLLNFDNIYESQNFYLKSDYNIIDLTDIRSNIYYCEKKSLDMIDSRLKESDIEKVRFIGSGNYHYITYLFLKRIESRFTLILFDNHTEILSSDFNPYISCGSWILKSLETIENLEHIIMIGVNEKYLDLIPKKYKNKITIINNSVINNIKQVENIILSESKNEKVYISIDKDVLRKEDCLTNWDHGDMKLSELLYILEDVLENFNVLGIDICGEFLDRKSNVYEYSQRKALNLNNKANYNILKTIIAHYN